MRVITPIRRSLKDDRGVAAALTVVVMTVLLGMSALVVDIGNAWQARRHVITSTDAAALAAAQEVLKTGTANCDAIAQDYVTRNNSNATLLPPCQIVTPSGSTPGRVTVTAEVDVDYIFGPILGITGTTVESSTTVSYGLAGSIDSELRPFGLCADLIDPAWIGDSMVHDFLYGKDAQPNACNAEDPVPGNWGVIDFDFGSSNAADTAEWTEFGYTGPPPVEINKWYTGRPGATAPGSLTPLLNDLKNDGTIFPLPVFDRCRNLDSPGSPCNVGRIEYYLVGFVAVRIDDFKLTGPDVDRYFNLEFYDLEVVQGGGGGTIDLGAYVIGICAVDDVDVAANCG